MQTKTMYEEKIIRELRDLPILTGTRFMRDKILSSIERRTKCPLSRNKQ